MWQSCTSRRFFMQNLTGIATSSASLPRKPNRSIILFNSNLTYCNNLTVSAWLPISSHFALPLAVIVPGPSDIGAARDVSSYKYAYYYKKS